MPFLDRRLLVLIVLLTISVALAILFIDQPVVDAMRGIGPGWRNVAEWVTGFGKSTGYLIGLGAAVVILTAVGRFASSPEQGERARRWAWVSLYLFLAVALPGLLNDLIKLLVGRPRPMVDATGLEPFTFGYDFQSFPSGHASVAFGLAFGVAMVWPMLRWPMLAFAAAVAASRVILNVHHLGDVLASVIVALVTVRALTLAFARRGSVFSIDAGGRPIAFTRRITPA
jgi:membrane-associated phospholipid phosphatase